VSGTAGDAPGRDGAGPDAAGPDGVPAPDAVVDCRGQRCPLPVIMLARALPGVPVGGTVHLLADDPAAATDIPAWCRLRGQDLVAVAAEGAATRFQVRRLA
jgi:tRNA 2-thiouridine synthesizing protein A